MLEFGTGRNLTKAIVEHYGIKHKSVDFDNERFFPDEVFQPSWIIMIKNMM